MDKEFELSTNSYADENQTVLMSEGVPAFLARMIYKFTLIK